MADASVRLASSTMRKTGSTELGAEGGPAPARLVQDALAIWSGARPDPLLARQMRAAANDLLAAHQCTLALPVLQAALGVAERADADAPTARAILQDTLKIALASGDDTVARTLAPRWITPGRTAPLTPAEFEVTFDLLAFDYRIEDNTGAEQLATQALALVPRDLPSAPAVTRRLKLELASSYYGQRRFAEGEAVREGLGNPASRVPSGPAGEFAKQRDALIAQVRAGDLPGAQTSLDALLPAYQRALETDRAAQASAERRLAELTADPTAPKPTVTQAQREAANARRQAASTTAHLGELQGDAGEILHAQGKLDAAAEQYETALATLAMAHVQTGPLPSRIRGDLALVQRARGKTALAIALQQQLLDELLPLLGPDHPDVREAKAELAAMRR